MPRAHAADDFDAIHARLEELRRERQQPTAGTPLVERPMHEPDAVAHVPGHIVRRYLAAARRSSAR
ncbi:MAG TPA: hypothetical protein VGG57_23760 [Stellaceae bacterium]|jgi:hypothetical protein